MRHDVPLPRLGETVDEVVVLEWRVDVGEAVAEGDVLLVVETDKVDAEVPSPTAGTLVERRVEVGATLTTGDVVCVVDAPV